MLEVSYTILTKGTTPLLASLVEAIQKIEIETSIDMASVFRIRFGITQTISGDWSILVEDNFKPLRPLQIRVKTGVLPPMTIINGYVASQEVMYADEAGGSALEVTGMDITMLMNLIEQIRPWPVTDMDIANAIFTQYALVPNVAFTAPNLMEPEGTTTQRGTDIRFLRQLARRNSYECFVFPDPLTGKDFGYFGPRISLPALPEAVINVKMGSETNVSEFKIRYEMLRPTSAAGGGVDSTTRTPQFFLAVATKALTPFGVPLGIEPTLQRILPPPPLTLPTETGQMSPSGLATAVQGVVDRSSWAVVAEGTVGPDIGILRPGGIINVRGAGRLYNGAYYVTRVSHSIEYGCYTQKFQAARNAVTMTGTELYASV